MQNYEEGIYTLILNLFIYELIVKLFFFTWKSGRWKKKRNSDFLQTATIETECAVLLLLHDVLEKQKKIAYSGISLM